MRSWQSVRQTVARSERPHRCHGARLPRQAGTRNGCRTDRPHGCRLLPVRLMAECPAHGAPCPQVSAPVRRSPRQAGTPQGARHGTQGHATGAPCPNPSGKPERHGTHGTGHRNAAADRGGREPVRQAGTPRRTLAALFPAIVSEPVRRTASRPAAWRTVAACPSGSWQAVRRRDRNGAPCPQLSADVRRCPQMSASASYYTYRTVPYRTVSIQRTVYRTVPVPYAVTVTVTGFNCDCFVRCAG